jgi:cytochrome c oxidase subunit III
MTEQDKHIEEKKDTAGSRFGMWLFLMTEILLFSGLFLLYAGYLTEFPVDFKAAGKELDHIMGTLNTVILLISSFTVAASITAIKKCSKKASLGFLSMSIFLGLSFLINKYFEWSHHIKAGVYPNSPGLEDAPHGKVLFFGLYYVITGLHAIHVLVGMVLLTICAVLVKKDRISKEKYIVLENSGLYWHLVDLIWIFIFPLFYLIV